MKETVPSVDVKPVDALTLAGIVPLPIAPLTEPVTAKSVAELNATEIVCATALAVSWSVPSDEPLGFVLGDVASAELPSAPLVVPLTSNAVADVNWTISVSLTVAPTTLLIEPLFD